MAIYEYENDINLVISNVKKNLKDKLNNPKDQIDYNFLIKKIGKNINPLNILNGHF